MSQKQKLSNIDENLISKR